MVAAPRHVYNATLTNNAAEAVTVTFTRKDKDGNLTTAAHEVAPGQAVEAPRQSTTDGSAEFVVVVEKVEVKTAAGKTASLAAPFNVFSPTTNYKFAVTITESGDVAIAESA
jgi:hypothetical protein